MKKSILLLILTLAVAALAACGGNGGAPNAPGETSPPVDTSAPDAEAIDTAALPFSVDVHTAHALQDNPDVLLVDVREPDEYAESHIPGITLIPVGEVADRLSELPQDKQIIFTCREGNRSTQVAELLQGMGYTNVHTLDGGMLAWQEAGYAVE